jgi:hypothetical protein
MSTRKKKTPAQRQEELRSEVEELQARINAEEYTNIVPYALVFIFGMYLGHLLYNAKEALF